MTSKIECLIDAIGFYNTMHDPESLAYRLRNPLLVKSFSRPGKNEIDNEGHRVFNSVISGYRACFYDAALKLEGRSRAGLKPTDKLHNILGCYGIKDAGAVSVVLKFLRRALQDPSVSADTPLSYFLPVETK